ncbi:MAG TPA: hypothetical protein VK822_32285 [Acetobacteraceae bacterium]|nr:hypothetical protein [Acetobacteraceae bacterium]
MEPNSAKVFRTMNTSSPRVLLAVTLVVAALAQDALAASKTGIEGSSGSLGSKGPAFTAVRFRWGGGGHYNFHGYNFHQDIVHNNINVIGNGNGYRGGGWNGGWGPNWGGVGAGVAIGAGIATAAAAAAAATTYPPPPPVVYGYPYPYPYPVYGYPP